MTAPDNGKYTITKVVQSSAYSPQLGAYPTKQVHYRLYDGTTGHVELHTNDYTAENVAQVLDAVHDNHKQVMALNTGQYQSDYTSTDNPFS